MKKVLAIGLAALVLGGFGGWQFYRSVVFGPGPLAEPTIVTVEPGDGLNRISDRLLEAGVIAQPYFFRLQAYVDGVSRQLTAGEYAFDAGTPLIAVLSKLVRHDVLLHSLTIPEGWSSVQVLAEINGSELLTGPPVATLSEGVVLPETYVFPRGKRRSDLIVSMAEGQRQLLDQLWLDRDDGLPLNSPEEAVILASIVERETAVPSERGLVASVFLNRLRRGMRLQSDPTVIYGMAEGAPFERAITRSDLRGDTPYNTYVIDRLPPGPICHPGADSLRAVLKPEVSDYLYFVADGTGGHAFARTLAEHNRNVANWRRIRDRGNP